MAECLSSGPGTAFSGGRVRVGVSSCLLGEAVRYDGGHKHNPHVEGGLSRFLELIPICPEMAIGLGVPREPIHLVAGAGEAIRVIGVHNREKDVTESLRAYGRRIGRERTDLHGYIFKGSSPSCGQRNVPVHKPDGAVQATAPGAFADALMIQCPHLPVEEGQGLADPARRASFIERVFAHERFQQQVATDPTPQALMAFHSAHKPLVRAYDAEAVHRLERRIASAGSGDINERASAYLAELMAILATRPAMLGAPQ